MAKVQILKSCRVETPPTLPVTTGLQTSLGFTHAGPAVVLSGHNGMYASAAPALHS